MLQTVFLCNRVFHIIYGLFTIERGQGREDGLVVKCNRSFVLIRYDPSQLQKEG